jgi:predicted DNA binding CopG/RHH family protein
MKKPFKLPKFKNEAEERKFWSKISLADYAESKDLKKVIFPNLKPTTRPISLRLPENIILQAKIKANKLNIPYQSLIKQYIAMGVKAK